MRKNQIILFYLLLLLFSLPLQAKSVKCYFEPSFDYGWLEGIGESAKQATVSALEGVKTVGEELAKIGEWTINTIVNWANNAKQQWEQTVQNFNKWRESTAKSIDQQLQQIWKYLQEAPDIISKILNQINYIILQIQQIMINIIGIVVNPFIYLINSLIEIGTLIAVNIDKIFIAVGTGMIIIGALHNMLFLAIGIPLFFIGTAPYIGSLLVSFSNMMISIIQAMHPLTILAGYLLAGVGFSMIIFTLLRRAT